MASTAPRDVLRPLRVPAYSFLGVTLFLQILDFTLGVLPLRPTAIVWRFAALGLAAGNIGNILLLILLFYAFALLLGDRIGLVVVFVVTLTSAIVLLLAAGGFALDSLQLRSKVDPQVLSRFDSQVSGAMVKFVVQAIISTLFAFSSWYSYKASKREFLREQRGEEAVIVKNSAARMN